MGCNCNKDKISLRKKIRQETKAKITEVKRLWKESSNKGTIVTANKKDLGFK